MADIGQGRASAVRLNPFAFPSDTDFRFVLLIASVLGSALFIYEALYYSFPGYAERTATAYLRCFDVAGFNETSPSIDQATTEELMDRSNAFFECTASLNQQVAVWSVAGLLGLTVVCALIVWALPRRIHQRLSLEPLAADDAPEIVAALADLCREVGLARPPTFVWNPLDPRPNGLAFGGFGRYYIALTGGLVTQFGTDPAAFRAVVLHELAHLRNADVNKTFVSLAIWWAFLATAVTPYVGVVLYALVDPEESASGLIRNGWPLLPLAMLVYLYRSGVLRARELYADFRAYLWDGPEGALRRVIIRSSPRQESPWLAPLRLHPTPVSRSQALSQPDRLLQLRWWDACGTGIAAGVAFPNLIHLFNNLPTESANPYSTVILAALIVTLPAVGVVGLGVWRTTFSRFSADRPWPDAGRLGLGLGLGLLLGLTFSFQTAVAITEETGGWAIGQATGPGPVIFDILWAILLLASLRYLIRWIADGAYAWLAAVGGLKTLRAAYVVGLILASGLLAAWLALLMIFRTVGGGYLDSDLSLTGVQTVLVVLIFEVTGNFGLPTDLPISLIALIVLWAFPCAAWLLQRRATPEQDSHWMFIDEPIQPPVLPPRPALHLKRAVRAGLVAGVIFLALLLPIFAVWRFGVSEATRNTDEMILAFTYGQLTLSAVLQAIVAAKVAIQERFLREIHGLFAAFVAGCVITMGMLVYHKGTGHLVDDQSFWWAFHWVIVTGAALVLPIFGVLALLRVLPLASIRRGRATKRATALPAHQPESGTSE